ncbi:hypothetical protein ACA910_014660 [Epithemia clementina (nom. ined.)]
MSPTYAIKDQVALVTGTNKKNGIGHAIVHALVQEGARKVYATARHASELEELVSEFEEGKVVAVELDVVDMETIKKLPQLYPDVTCIVNNAGYLYNGKGGSSIMDMNDDSIANARLEMEVNYIAPLAIVSAFAPLLQKADQSAVVNIASVTSFMNLPGVATYSSSKAAIYSLTQAQRRDLPNTLVLGVYPGPIDTDMAKGIPLDTTPPSTVAEKIVQALKEGQEDLIPDVYATQMIAKWNADPKKTEKELANSALAH